MPEMMNTGVIGMPQSAAPMSALSYSMSALNPRAIAEAIFRAVGVIIITVCYSKHCIVTLMSPLLNSVVVAAAAAVVH